MIILAGVSGNGKTHIRLNDPALRDLPYVDIADIYEEYPEFDWLDALYTLLAPTYSFNRCTLGRRSSSSISSFNSASLSGRPLPA